MKISVAMAQVNPTVGDLRGNSRLVADYIQRAVSARANIVVFPEMVITGYPPQDLLPPREVRPPGGNRKPEQEEFVRLNKKHLFQIASEVHDIAAIVGFVDYDGYNLYNAAAIINHGSVTSVVYKTLLPTYDVFDEHRYFTPAPLQMPVEVDITGAKVNVGCAICEDMWDEQIGYGVKVLDALVGKGAQLILSSNASPYHDKVREMRLEILRNKARRLEIPIVYVNMVGGQDDLVFDGESLAVDSEGRLIGIGKKFEEDLVVVDAISSKQIASELPRPIYNREEEMFCALVLGVRDYFRKTGFNHAFIGLSGGIDSSLVAVITAEALGKENVTGVSMPSRYSSDHSMKDAEELATNLGIHFITIPIEAVFSSFENQLRPFFEQRPPNVAEENLQSRIRGCVLMALSNKFDDLVLATGNKTELALGYATLYGDMNGGLEVIGDVSKMEVYALAQYYNAKRAGIIPENCFTKIPSAELKPDQFDPFDYSIVSPLVDEIIENRLSKQELIDKGYDLTLVVEILRRIRAAEYKRHQAAPSIKITKKAFGLGWKMPIVNRFTG